MYNNAHTDSAISEKKTGKINLDEIETKKNE
jgi:hypothetical protein